MGRHVYRLPETKPHMDCRRLELIEATHAIDRDRLVWLVAEQDMGGDDFLAMLRQSQGFSDQEVFKLDLCNFEGLTDDLHSLQAIIVGGDFNRLCEQLVTFGPAYLLLDDVRLGSADQSRKVASEVRELAQIALDFCPELKVIVRSFLPIQVVGLQPVTLRALDEPESKSYVELHPLGKGAIKEDINLGAIYSHTGGWPGRIDKLLRALGINSFEAIAHGSSDESIDEKATLPSVLVNVIDRMMSGDQYEQKKFNLLKGLCFFKCGEAVDTIKYFSGRQRLRPGMGDDLVADGLAEPAETNELIVKPGEQDRFVVIKPTVVQYMHKLLGEKLLVTYYEEAAEIYFGRDWRVGIYKLHSAFRFSSHRIHSVIEQNAALIITRLISDALDREEHELRQKDILSRVSVLHYYLLKLVAGDKYLYVVRLCRTILPKLTSYDSHNLVKDIRYQYARGLRMLGEYEESILQCELLLTQANPVNIVAGLYINMAYAYEHTGDIEKTEFFAKAVLGLKLKGNEVYHAKSIILGLSNDDSKYVKLSRLAVKARHDGCNISSNNMMMDVISELNDPIHQMNEYKSLAERARHDGDSYNMFRAVVNWMEIAVEQDVDVTKENVDSLLSAYTYACSQRQRKMFNQSHRVLWDLLEKAGQVESLLHLFRHSSTLQRLTDKVNLEATYLKRLVGYVREIGLDQVVRSCDPTTLRYFAARATSHNLLSAKQLQLMS